MADDGTNISTNPDPETGRARGGLRAPSRSSSFNVSFREVQRRQSASISDILETARERADTMNSGTASPHSRSTSPVAMTRAASQPPPHATIAEEPLSADETTGIVSRGDGPSYQTIQSADGSLRSRKSIYGRKSQPNSQPELASWGQQQGDAATNGTADGTDGEPERPWWRRTLARFQSVELDNKGSVARDHLALERTFLAWLRTSLAFASIGIAVTQLFRLNTSLPSDGGGNSGPIKQETLRSVGRPLGATFLGISILILLLGYRRYFVTQEWVIKGKFPASRGTIIVVSLVAFALMALSLVVVIVIQPAGDQDL